MHRLIQIGDRAFNLEAVTHCAYQPCLPGTEDSNPDTQCIISFGCEDIQIFYGDEAEVVWTIIKQSCLRFRSENSTEAKKNEVLTHG